MPRYFFGIAPPEPLLGTIEAFRTRWRNPHHKVEPHITLIPPFEWDGSPALVMQMAREACRRVRPFRLALGGPGRFARSRVLFLTVAAGPELAELERALAAGLGSIARPDPRSVGQGFHAHLTLASGRFGIDDDGLDAMEQEAAAVLAGLPPFNADRVRAYRWGAGEHRWSRLDDVNLG